MAIIVDFIRRLAPWIYGACALAALWYLGVVIRARRDRHYAVFSLEREQALNRVYGAWGGAILLILVIGATYLLSTVVSDALRPMIAQTEPATPTPTATVSVGAALVTPTPPLPDTTPTNTPTRRPRPTALPQPPTLPQSRI